MNPDIERSEQVVEAYKKHKLAASALRRIQEIIHGFERDRAVDVRLAIIGMTFVLAFLGYLAFLFFSSESVTLELGKRLSGSSTDLPPVRKPGSI